MKWLPSILALVALACAPSPRERAAPPSIAPTGMCRPVPVADLPPSAALEFHGVIDARRIYATPGRLACSEAALGAVECFARQGRSLVRLEAGSDVAGFELLDREALRISADHVVCTRLSG